MLIFVDAASPLPGLRLSQFLSESGVAPDHDTSPPRKPLSTELLTKLVHLTTPTLPQLIALLGHSSSTFPPPGASLMVIDSLSTLVANAYPRIIDNSATPKKPGLGQFCPLLDYSRSVDLSRYSCETRRQTLGSNPQMGSYTIPYLCPSETGHST